MLKLQKKVLDSGLYQTCLLICIAENVIQYELQSVIV